MIKIERPPTPSIKVYTKKDRNISLADRTKLIQLIDPASTRFSPFIERLKDIDARFTRAEEETLKSILYYADPANFKDDKKLTSSSGPNFKVYKDDELKEILVKTFHKKCAYCESKFLAVSPADIEHFRPKAAINRFVTNKDEKLIYPGYYWLAADWDNLLWSCILCNRKNNLDTPLDDGPQPLGKKNRFPVADELKRVRSHNDELEPEHELKLILDPCRDEPKKHLYFPLKGNDLGIVKSVILDNQLPSPKGEASIPVYGLNRVELVFARKEEALDLKAIFLGMLRSMEAFIRKKKANEDPSAEEEEFKQQKQRFNSKLKSDSEYLALKQHLLEEFKEFDLVKKLNLKIENLIDN